MFVIFWNMPIHGARDRVTSTRGIISMSLTWVSLVSFSDFIHWHGDIKVDGNGWSGRFKRLMTSNSLIFKSTIYPEWLVSQFSCLCPLYSMYSDPWSVRYADRVSPWVHYIPIQIDLSDLHDALLFFRGDANGVGSHEYLARKIASAGRQWSKRFWRKEDLVSYFFR